MTDFDIKVKGASSITISGTNDNTMILPATAKIDSDRNQMDIDVENMETVKIGLPENSEKIELACTDASVSIRDLCFTHFEIDGKGNLAIEASNISGKLDINLVGGEAVLAVPADFSFRLVNEGRNCKISSNVAEDPDSTNVVEFNGKDSSLSIRIL
ncbi:MAG: hypothetical protein J5379_03400 [Clostridiales bacterium]|nr:hypothetical protein [Clostridiales bacterium]